VEGTCMLMDIAISGDRIDWDTDAENF
jgi:hypothetical protein